MTTQAPITVEQLYLMAVHEIHDTGQRKIFISMLEQFAAEQRAAGAAEMSAEVVEAKRITKQQEQVIIALHRDAKDFQADSVNLRAELAATKEENALLKAEIGESRSYRVMATQVTDEELIAYASEAQFFLFAGEDDVLDIMKETLSAFASRCASKTINRLKDELAATKRRLDTVEPNCDDVLLLRGILSFVGISVPESSEELGAEWIPYVRRSMRRMKGAFESMQQVVDDTKQRLEAAKREISMDDMLAAYKLLTEEHMKQRISVHMLVALRNAINAAIAAQAKEPCQHLRRQTHKSITQPGVERDRCADCGELL